MWKTKDFIGRKQEVIEHFKNNPVNSDKISEYCTLAGIPLTVVYEFIGDEFSEYKEKCDNKIAELNKFYGIFK